MKIRPLHDRVVVKRIEEAETMRNGLFIPEVAKEKPQEGQIIATGTGRLENGVLVPLDIKDGDYILFGKYSGTEIEINGEKLLILREEEIQAVLESEDGH
jgi:chaperonin GroES